MPQELKLPEVGEGIETGTVIALLVKEGDRIEVDQPVLELETDKAVVEVPATVAGVVTKVHLKANTEARIGEVMITVDPQAAGGDAPADAQGKAADDAAAKAEPTESKAASAEPVAPEGAATQAAEAKQGAEAKQPAAAKPAASGETGRDRPAPASAAASAAPVHPGLVPAAPSVRRMAREQGVDLRHVTGSGILGRISAADVERFANGGGQQAPSAPAPVALPDFSRWGETERVAMSGIRKATVRSMTQAWSTVPMVTHFDEADATDFEAARQRHKAAAERAGTKLAPTAMLVKVVAAALKRFPDFNASIDVASQEIVYKRYVNVGVAVDTPHGLLVPVIKDADKKNMLELSADLAALAAKARDRKLNPDDMSGGNFSVSNLGGIGGTGFTPIVNPPEVAILGVSRGAMKPVWNEEEQAFAPRLVMPLALSYDHRLIDGASAARFLRWVCQAIEDPYLLSLEG